MATVITSSPSPIPTPIPKTTPQTNNGFIGYVNGQIQTFPTREAAEQAGATGIEPNYQRFPAGTTTTPTEKETTTIDPTTTTSTTEALDESSQLAAVGVANSETTGSSTPWVLLTIVIVLGVGYGIYYFKKGKNK